MTAPSPPSGAVRRRQRSGRRAIRALFLTPTRELAGQIGGSIATYGKYCDIRHTVVYGGVSQNPQVHALRAGIDVLVATPGRLLDLIDQGYIDLSTVEILVLDEADQMLDMGFIHDLRKIVAHVPDQRQTLMFSATMPPQIRELAKQWLRRPLEVKVAAVASTPERVSQAVCFVERQYKTKTLVEFLHQTARSKTLVFSRTKHGADKLARSLKRDGIPAISIHGNKSQNQRLAAMREFNSHQPPVLVATDLAARGLDFSDVSHVINYDLPDVPEVYVHRIGRTARAGASGTAISFCGHDERQRLRMIERLTGQSVPVARLAGSAHESTPAAAAASRVAKETTGDLPRAAEPAGRRSAKRRHVHKQRRAVANSTSRHTQGRSRKRRKAKASAA